MSTSQNRTVEPGLTAEQAGQRAEAFRADVQALRAEIGKAIVGQAEVVDGVITCLMCNGHALLEGVPGIGKTMLIRTLAQAMDLHFSRIQFTPDLMPADITGTTVVLERTDESGSGRTARELVFQRGPIFAQMVLADEINRATPKTQAALLEAMAERSVTVGGTTHVLEKPFFVLATQNPVEQEGTYPLPEAQLDRFFFKLLVTASSRKDLLEILERTTTGFVPQIQGIVNASRLLEHQQIVRLALIAPHVADYAVRLVLGTHGAGEGGGAGLAGGERFSTPMVDRYVRLGASPRAAQAIVLAAKCRALMYGRASASIEDIAAIAKPALRHRLILNFEAQAEGISADAIIDNLLATLPQGM